MPLRWGILAPGSIASVFARDLNILDPTHLEHRIISVGSRDAVRAAQFAAKFQIDRHYGSYSQVLQSDDVDIVYIANVQSGHFQTVISALEAGKHVLCEKPFAMNVNEARSMFQLAKEKKLFLMEAMWTRFLPHIIEVLRMINDGAIGQPRYILADHGQWVYRKVNHRLLDPDKGGGALLDLGVYPVTLSHLILGAPEKIDAHAHFAPSGVDSDVAMIFGHPSGATSLLHTTLESVTATRATIAGSLGRIEIDRSFYAPTGFSFFGHDGSTFRYENPLLHPDYVGLGEQVREVARCISEGLIESPLRPERDTLEVMEILDRVRKMIGLRYPCEVSDPDDTGVIS
jgi:predicted dehydrogenase